VGIKHHFIRENIKEGRLHLAWVPTGEQAADVLTKSLPPRVFAKHRERLMSQMVVRAEGSVTVKHPHEGEDVLSSP